MLVSVHARTSVAAVVGAYAAMLAWMVLPIWAFAWLAPRGMTGLSLVLKPIARELARSSPISLLDPVEIWGRGSGPGVFIVRIWEMATIQLGLGLALFALAAWRLRPAYRAQVGGLRARWPGQLARVLGLRGGSRPPCGDDPIAWKERSLPELAWLARLALLAALALVAHSTIVRIQGPWSVDLAFDELFANGFDVGTWGEHGVRRANLNSLLCEHAAILFGAAMVASTILAAAGIAGGTGPGDLVGAARHAARPSGDPPRQDGGGGPAGPDHPGVDARLFRRLAGGHGAPPVRFALAVVGSVVFLWFAVALGTYVSARSKDAGLAIVRTALILAAVDFAPVAVTYPWLGYRAMAFAPPVMMTFLPISRMHLRTFTQAALSCTRWCCLWSRSWGSCWRMGSGRRSWRGPRRGGSSGTKGEPSPGLRRAWRSVRPRPTIGRRGRHPSSRRPGRPPGPCPSPGRWGSDPRAFSRGL